MGARPEAPRRCWAPWLLGFTSLLLSAFSTVVRSPGARGSDVEDSGSRVSLKGIQGGSVVFHVIRCPDVPPEAELEKVSWAFKNKTNYVVLLRVSPGVDGPEWVNSRDKLEKRVHVLNTMTLRMDKLTLEDSGWYRARSSFTAGIESSQDFHLSVYVSRKDLLPGALRAGLGDQAARSRHCSAFHQGALPAQLWPQALHLLRLKLRPQSQSPALGASGQPRIRH
ncbi:uncharacterized protein LOC115287195 [Suricata suricatta]|uniref:uncharacterized protein LOC115287195 n=1 Tax=Suricata suricatta TaxID=37032 RepID=UPI001155B101|nr:uncharacterized protein LOC115287195 [Suricata suricatta]